VGKDGAEMVLIPEGEFQMGSNTLPGNVTPVHTVYLDAFYMDKYEVTNAQFKKFFEANPQWRKDRIDSIYHYGDYLQDWNGINYPSGKADHPVVYVCWDAAAAYAQWAQKRLPTEAEWEKAARGGLVGKKYPWGGNITHDDANYSGTGGKDKWNGTSPVGSFAPNGYGLYDVAGNVWEWCSDWYDSGYYANSPKNNPQGPSSGTMRVLRGGSWSYYSTDYLRCAYRDFSVPTIMRINGGFRCAQDL
jgi:formylglycine-generating enzyme required for sulfatase activity